MTAREIIEHAVATVNEAHRSARVGLQRINLIEGECEDGDKMFVVDDAIYILNSNFPLRRLYLLEGNKARIVNVDINPTTNQENPK